MNLEISQDRQADMIGKVSTNWPHYSIIFTVKTRQLKSSCLWIGIGRNSSLSIFFGQSRTPNNNKDDKKMIVDMKTCFVKI